MVNRKKIFVMPALLVCLSIPSIAFAKKPKVYTPVQEIKHQQKILRAEEKEKYKRSLLPPSGCMTREEYESMSVDIPNEKRQVPEFREPKDVKMKYVPQPLYELVLYNNPPGTPELSLQHKFTFDRQAKGPAIISPRRDILVTPIIYYYVNNQCTAGDLFVIPLDKTLPDLDRVLRANFIKRVPAPILSTPKDINEKYTFRTMTPVDFSPDGRKLIAKEKIGHMEDGIWQTNLWVYDFDTSEAKNLYQVRDAIRYYWKNTEGLVLDEKRWDITPLGFSAENPDRIIVSAYGYTGTKPKFLGNWSIDTKGERSELISLFDAAANVSVSGLRLSQIGLVNPAQVHNDEKAQNKKIKKDKKSIKKAKKADKKFKKQALKKKLRELKKEEAKMIRDYHKKRNFTGATGS